MLVKRTLTVIAAAVFLGQGCAKPAVTPTPEPAAQSDSSNYSTSPSNETAAPVAEVPSTPSDSSSSTTVSEPNRSNLAFPGVLPAMETANKLVRIKTAKGDIVFELLPSEGPNAASNFVYLIKNNYFNGLNFHRREPGFVIQGGDPNGNGTGGPGYRFADDPVKLPYDRGIVAMANAGPSTNGSQFFIMLGDTPLPPLYSVFGRVVSGMDVVDQIVVGDVMTSVTLEDKK